MGYYCGIDLGNKESVICVLDGRRQVILDESVKTEAAAIKKLLKEASWDTHPFPLPHSGCRRATRNSSLLAARSEPQASYLATEIGFPKEIHTHIVKEITNDGLRRLAEASLLDSMCLQRGRDARVRLL